MPVFEYYGRDAEGRSVKGRRLSQSEDNLSVQLGKEGVTLISVSVERDKTQVLEKIKKWLGRTNVSVDELSIFARQMYTLSKTGVPITYALRQLAENARSLPLSSALHGIVERLESGVDLASAMSEYPRIFDTIMVSMVRVGQNTGHLDEAFLRLNQYLELESVALKRAKTAIRYPIFVFIALIVAVISVNVFVIPTFSNVFKQSNIELPGLTVFLVGMSNLFMHQWGYLLFFTVIIVVALYHYLKTPRGKLAWHKYQLKLPIIGPILKRIYLLRFAQTFSVIIDSGVPLLDGIELVSHAMNNQYVASEVLSMRDAIQHGKSLSQAAAGIHLFTPLELQMLVVSEETGELSAMMDQVASYYRREVEYDLKRLSDVIEPVLIVGLSIVILGLAFAVYLPIWNMVKLVHT